MDILIVFISHAEHLHLLHIQTLCYLSACCTTIYRTPILINTIVYIHGLYQLAWDVEIEAIMREQQDLEESRSIHILHHDEVALWHSAEEAAPWDEHRREAAAEVEAEEIWEMYWTERDP